MAHLGARSLFVLMKIGYDLQAEFADTFNDDLSAFGPLIEALEAADGALQLPDREYRWLSDDAFFDLGCRLPAPPASSHDRYLAAA
ncbi:MAG TPA: hypothetical protein VGO18_24785 [Steroidobacteraceae bacterium]|jgi:hypothetical protein|nr:hypothetical protein [Steroidobacteraceae bacterium]